MNEPSACPSNMYQQGSRLRSDRRVALQDVKDCTDEVDRSDFAPIRPVDNEPGAVGVADDRGLQLRGGIGCNDWIIAASDVTIGVAKLDPVATPTSSPSTTGIP